MDHDPHSRPSAPPDSRLESNEALEEARESYDYWRKRTSELSVYKRAERQEAQAMTERWKQRLAEAERARYGPSLLEQLLTALGVRHPPHLPSRRRVIVGLSVGVFLLVTILILLAVAVIVFWPHIAPIVHDLGGSNGNG